MRFSKMQKCDNQFLYRIFSAPFVQIAKYAMGYGGDIEFCYENSWEYENESTALCKT